MGGSEIETFEVTTPRYNDTITFYKSGDIVCGDMPHPTTGGWNGYKVAESITEKLPESFRPPEQKEFICFGMTTSDSYKICYGRKMTIGTDGSISLGRYITLPTSSSSGVSYINKVGLFYYFLTA